VLRGKADVFFELHRRREELSRSLRLNEMFVGILGHDLRNPLGTIMNGANLLERQLEEAGQLATVRRMLSAGPRMSNMIQQLLDLTRARLGELDFVVTKRDVQVDELVRRAADELAGAHPERSLVVEARGDGRAQGDPDRLLQLFSNLIANALQHGAAGTPVSVTVDGRQDDIEVGVRNLGAIPPELLPTLFDPFRGRTGNGKSHGLGLGLFISPQIARAHGGLIEVETNHATVFTVRLPRFAA
jgi:signal transduction histidine kinase